jgi:hypothetical protein
VTHHVLATHLQDLQRELQQTKSQRDLTEKEWLTVVNPSQRPWTAMCVFDWTVFDGNDVDPEDFPHGGPMIFDGKVTVRDVLTAIAHLKHPFGWFEGIEQLSSGQWQLKFGP